MRVIKINSYRVHLNNKKKNSNWSKFIIYKDGVKGDLDGGYLKWEDESCIIPRLTKILKEKF